MKYIVKQSEKSNFGRDIWQTIIGTSDNYILYAVSRISPQILGLRSSIEKGDGYQQNTESPTQGPGGRQTTTRKNTEQLGLIDNANDTLGIFTNKRMLLLDQGQCNKMVI